MRPFDAHERLIRPVSMHTRADDCEGDCGGDCDRDCGRGLWTVKENVKGLYN